MKLLCNCKMNYTAKNKATNILIEFLLFVTAYKFNTNFRIISHYYACKTKAITISNLLIRI